MRISGSRDDKHVSGDLKKSRENAAAAQAAKSGRGAEQEAAELAAAAAPDAGARREASAFESADDTVIGGRVMRIDSLAWIEIDPEDLSGWLEEFAERSGGPLTVAAAPHGLHAQAADGTVADCHLPFAKGWPAASEGVAEADLPAAATAHVTAPRTVGVLLARLGAYVVGVFSGTELVTWKAGGRPGGSRLAGQANTQLAAASDAVARVLLPAKVDALVVGGESFAVSKVMTDRRLTSLQKLGAEPSPISIDEPTLEMLKYTPEQFMAIRIRLLRPEIRQF